MTQHNQEHLTITQLSAYLDQELASDELALCRVHLQICQPCQAALADLHLTSALLHGIPQVEVPRAFVLPSNLVLLPNTPASDVTRPARVFSRGQDIARHTLRALSTIAAIIGVVFLLLGAFSSIPNSGVGISNTIGQHALRNNAPAGTRPNTPPTYSSQTRSPSETGNGKVTPASTPTFTMDHPSTQRSEPQSTLNTPPMQVPAVLDLGQPLGRLSFGAAFLLLGILGLFWAHRFKRAPDH